MRLLIKPIWFLAIFCLFLFQCSINEDERTNRKDSKQTPLGTGATENPPVTITLIDLTITAFNTASSYTQDQIYDIPVTIRNNGPDTAGTFTVAISSDSNANSLSTAFSYNDIFAGKLIINSLAANTETTVSVSYQPVFSVGITAIGAYVDSKSEVSETSEGNNYKVNNVTIN